jgi:hypothetical protein
MYAYVHVCMHACMYVCIIYVYLYVCGSIDREAVPWSLLLTVTLCMDLTFV